VKRPRGKSAFRQPGGFIAQFKTLEALVALRERQTLSEISVRIEVSPVVTSREKKTTAGEYVVPCLRKREDQKESQVDF
jgi:hypothetical protein